MARRFSPWFQLMIIVILTAQGLLPVHAPSIVRAADITEPVIDTRETATPGASAETATPGASAEAATPEASAALTPTDSPSPTPAVTPSAQPPSGTVPLPSAPTEAIPPTVTPPIAPIEAMTPTRMPAAPEPDLNLDLNLNLGLTLTVDPPWAEPGDVLTFTVVAANPESGPLPGLVLTDTLPDGLIYVQKSAIGFVYQPAKQQLTWPAGDVAAGAIITGSFQARVQGRAIGETVTNTVTAASPALAAVYRQRQREHHLASRRCKCRHARAGWRAALGGWPCPIAHSAGRRGESHAPDLSASAGPG